MKGTIQADGLVLGDNGKTYRLPKRKEGVLVDSKVFNGKTSFERQPIAPLIGKKVEFGVNDRDIGYNFIIMKDKSHCATKGL